ncbi:hypothetical protein LWI29_025797 [Acer saccharum]|uniref:Integrase catalytic domain-containing protein n=1 Tax=Acer saccharum TaxID=4024 RepID=A0AA39TI26_ACESA|nr:hypothetical protein LWI29_025797 [Acer saccharum]
MQEKTQSDGDAAVASKSYEPSEVLAVSTEDRSSEWILDSGCSFHMCPKREMFTEFQELNSTLDEEGYSYKAERGVLKASKGSLVILKGDKKNGLYVLRGGAVTNDAACIASKISDKGILWHMRLGNMSERGILELSKRNLLNGDQVNKLDFCECCVLGKQHRISFNTAQHTSKQILEYVHSNLWGPSKVPTHGGNRYFLSLIDDHSRKVWIYLLKSKDQAFESFKAWKRLAENQTSKKLKVLRTDNGLEFCNMEFNSFCDDQGILRHRTVRHTPQQNGVAERMNRTILDKVRCLLIGSSLS